MCLIEYFLLCVIIRVLIAYFPLCVVIRVLIAYFLLWFTHVFNRILPIVYLMFSMLLITVLS